MQVLGINGLQCKELDQIGPPPIQLASANIDTILYDVLTNVKNFIEQAPRIYLASANNGTILYDQRRQVGTNKAICEISHVRHNSQNKTIYCQKGESWTSEGADAIKHFLAANKYGTILKYWPNPASFCFILSSSQYSDKYTYYKI